MTKEPANPREIGREAFGHAVDKEFVICASA